MFFSSYDVAALNSISGGGKLPGLLLPDVGGDEQRETVVTRWKSDGIVDQEGSLTAFGMVPIRVIEQYRRAERHLFIGPMRISLDADGCLTVIVPADGGWELVRTTKEATMVVLLKKLPFLCGGSRRSEQPGSWESVSYEKWLDGIDPANTGNQVIVSRRDPQRPLGEVSIYGLRGRTGYEYNLSQARGRSMPIRDIRLHVAGLMGFERDHI